MTGDVIVFSLATDKQGRMCATQAVQPDGSGRMSVANLLWLIGLLIAPAAATWHFAQQEKFPLILGWYAGASALTYLVYWDDKKRARSGAWRTPENVLHLFELAGGWPGAFLAQRRLRHKSSKLTYQVVFWFIVALHQFAAIDYLLGWRWSRAMMAAFHAARRLAAQ